jgi:hypothetical protein
LVGRWKGQGIPKEKGANPLRGWTETHSWAWIFADGKPAGLSVTIDGGKVVAKGKLTHDAASNRYRMEASEPGPRGGRMVLEGKLDPAGKRLVLERTEASGAGAKESGKVRLSLRPNANFIRYTMAEDRQEPGDFQYSPVIEVGLTKEGESFAGGSTTSERPRCIVTGGAATMTLAYQGQSFPICCTGCRDEFNDNPQKYLKKAALILASGRGKAGSAPSRVSRFEDAFAGDVVDSERSNRPPDKGQRASSKTPTNASPAENPQGTPQREKMPQAKSGAKNDAARSAATKQAARAATLLRLGQNLEKSGKTAAALSYYRQIVKDLPDTPAAKTATERIKALDGT